MRLPVKLYHSLAIRASRPDKTHLLILQILSEWEQQQSVGKSAPPANPNVGNEVPSAQPCQKMSAEPESPKPTYAERREQALAVGPSSASAVRTGLFAVLHT